MRQDFADFTPLPGERIVWRGRPKLLRYVFSPFDLLIAAFLLVFFVLPFATLSQTPSAQSSQSGSTFLAFTFFALFFAAMLLLPRWLTKLGQVRSTGYLLTDRRVIIRRKRGEIVLFLDVLPYLEYRRSRFGTESILFAPQSPFEYAWGFWGAASTPGLMAIDDGRQVHELVSRSREAKA